ncbi:hypothetical protein IQ07DRAFT_6743 [Pyrenochaeta sp. DS3sAY3a]|nr:hypothetical protein IQ07DRAFT_6743 [Pyrenochaeta sp. DS3sAY3a]
MRARLKKGWRAQRRVRMKGSRREGRSAAGERRVIVCQRVWMPDCESDVLTERRAGVDVLFALVVWTVMGSGSLAMVSRNMPETLRMAGSWILLAILAFELPDALYSPWPRKPSVCRRLICLLYSGTQDGSPRSARVGESWNPSIADRTMRWPSFSMTARVKSVYTSAMLLV